MERSCAHVNPTRGITFEYKLERHLENQSPLEVGLAELYTLGLYFGMYVT